MKTSQGLYVRLDYSTILYLHGKVISLLYDFHFSVISLEYL